MFFERMNPQLLEPDVLKILPVKPPKKDLSIEDADRLSAKELNQLSRRERERVLYDLHGIAESLNEDEPGFVEERLAQLQESLDQNLPSKEAYEKALEIDSGYVYNRAFRLKFLRADLFDPHKAAIRLAGHLESKLELFGEELLCKDITQDDLDQGTLDSVYSGWIQQLPLRDMTGRVVFINFPRLPGSDVSVVHKLRRVFYTTMVASEDEETQRKGIVCIIWGTNESPDRLATWKVVRLLQTLPLRYAALHICFTAAQLKMHVAILALFKFACESSIRLRLRTHTGSSTELKYALQSFGIPVSVLPISDQGETLLEDDREKWEKRSKLERMRSSIVEGGTDIKVLRICIPGTSDILLGKGRKFQEHIGNIRFRYLIEEHRNRYEKAKKTQKTALADGIVSLVHKRSGRFLKDDGAGWVEVNELTAREKVSSCFRSFRKLHKTTWE